MDAIAADPQVAVPGRQLACRDHELLHPQYAAGYARELGGRLGRPLRSGDALVDAFFELNGDRAFAGFKSMPDRHADFAAFVRRPGLQVLTLVRRDLVATAASFLLAMTRGTWRRSGGVPAERLVLREGQLPNLRGNLTYLHRCLRQLAAVPDAIRLAYEDLCDPAFEAPELDRFFGRPVRLARPLPPTRAGDYVENLDALVGVVREHWAALERSAGAVPGVELRSR